MTEEDENKNNDVTHYDEEAERATLTLIGIWVLIIIASAIDWGYQSGRCSGGLVVECNGFDVVNLILAPIACYLLYKNWGLLTSEKAPQSKKWGAYGAATACVAVVAGGFYTNCSCPPF